LRVQLNTGTPRTEPPLKAALAAASAALLAPPVLAQQAAATPTWQADGAVLVYQEGDGRVRAVEPVVSLRRSDGNDSSMGLKLTLDSLTGASPNGAVAQPGVQTFTSPSGRSTYTTAAGRQPLDPSFKDTRVALAGTLERPFGEQQRVSWSANVSSEYDFASLSLSGAWARDFWQKNTTLSLGLSWELDRIKPVGGTPQGLQPISASRVGGTESRNVGDLLIGLTQVMNRRWLMQLNLGVGRGSGYHSDAYKLLSVVDGTSGLLIGDQYIAERRPDSRTRVSLFWRNLLHFNEDVLDASYRFYRDNWGVTAHTAELRWRTELAGGWYLEPRWRLHKQSAADFWRGWLVEGRDWNSTAHNTPLANASADPRLAAFTAQTAGLKLGLPLRQGEFSVRVEAYRQKQDQPAGAPGVLQTLQLAPALKATTLLVGWSRPF